MSVYQHTDAMGPHDLIDRPRIDIHDLRRLSGLAVLAVVPREFCHGISFYHGLFQKALFPRRCAHHRSELLVGNIVGAKTIAMHQQNPVRADVQDMFVRNEVHTAAVGKRFSKKKIPIAG